MQSIGQRGYCLFDGFEVREQKGRQMDSLSDLYSSEFCSRKIVGRNYDQTVEVEGRQRPTFYHSVTPPIYQSA